MILSYHTFKIHLKHPFKINHGVRDSQETFIVVLQEGDLFGYGEAPAIPYYNVSVPDMIEELEENREFIENIDVRDPEVLWNIFSKKIKNSFALCALDIAINDLYGKIKRKPLYRLWKLDMVHFPLTNYTIGIDTIENMVNKMKELPWPIYKIKLGTSDDVAIIKELRKHTHATFRVDANEAWNVEEAISNAEIFKKLNVEFIEQPLKASDMEGMKEVFKYSVLPVIADESCKSEGDVDNCYGMFHGINIKLTKCGGLTPARRMITNAKSLGMAVMGGCMTESTLGISALAQLLPLFDYVDMDGPLMIQNDIASGIQIQDGRIVLSKEHGIGAKLLVTEKNDRTE